MLERIIFKIAASGDIDDSNVTDVVNIDGAIAYERNINKRPQIIACSGADAITIRVLAG